MNSTGEDSSPVQKDIISVCVCTFKRPGMLSRLVETLFTQDTAGFFDFSIVVVDNDPSASAGAVIAGLQKRGSVPIAYYHLGEPNIASARNESVRRAQGNLVAFIDDDEFPDENWLLSLYKALIRFEADGILGPVRPHFELEPAKWIVRGRLCERVEFATGTVISDSKHTRTGNAMIKRNILDTVKGPFDPSFGKSGGSDSDLFNKLIKRGRVFIWCSEAVVFETIPIERQQRRYFLKRAFTRGMTTAWHIPFFSFSTLKSLLAVVAYTLALPFLFIAGHHLFMKCLIKNCDHLGRILAYIGITVVKERPY